MFLGRIRVCAVAIALHGFIFARLGQRAARTCSATSGVPCECLSSLPTACYVALSVFVCGGDEQLCLIAITLLRISFANRESVLATTRGIG